MKKIFAILILMVLAVSLIAPVAVLAQKEKLKDCCTIRQDMSWKKGTIYTACNEAGCTGTPIDCSVSPYCSLTKNDTLGDAKTGVGVSCPTPTTPDAFVKRGSAQWGMICIVNTVMYATNWIFYLMMIAVVIMFVIAAAMFMMSGGDAEKTKGAKGMMVYAIIGLVIALIAKLIPSIVKLVVGM
ncbi:MAG: pilin [Candidatus Gribaldobacteria bacterium]|nr:pilin [Candidatus Gribaldobacteria bacterium]